MTIPLLDKQDLDSPTWKKIEKFAKIRLDSYRKQNDNMVDIETTCLLRGRIDVCKEILELNPENEDI